MTGELEKFNKKHFYVRKGIIKKDQNIAKHKIVKNTHHME